MTPYNTSSQLNRYNMNKLLFCTIFFLSVSYISFAQTDNSSSKAQEEFTFFKDDANNIFFIDFETIDVNLSEVVVKDIEGNVLITDAVSDLPVNTIYELDCSNFRDGEYVVELHSYTAILRKPFSLDK